jgi:uncharacterized protein YndB with AHSA1/START domain
MSTAATSADFVITRVFDAPRDLVWEVFTEAGHLKHWWGPKGCSVFHAQVDLRPGGVYLYGLAMAGGAEVWGKISYREIAAPERMTMIVSFSDRNGGVTRHPMAPVWPLQWASEIVFEAVGSKTKVTLRSSPAGQTTPEERAAFDSGRDSLRGGWSGCFDALDGYLAGLRKT